MNRETFEMIEIERGCGYWFVCDDHCCPCSPTAQVSKGYDEKVYESMKRQQNYEE